MISVIIPVYNASRTLERCLETIFNSDYKNFEVIIVDDGSIDNTLEIAKKFKVRIIKLDVNSGPGTARNKGAEVAKGEILAFVDSDCEVPLDWLSKIYNFFKMNSSIGAITGPYTESVEKKTLSLFQHYDILYFQKPKSNFINSCTSSNLACYKKLFFEVGGFPPIRVNEDMIFASKLSKLKNIYWYKDNGVAHNYRSNLCSYIKQQKTWISGTLVSYLSRPSLFFEKGSFSKGDVGFQLGVFGLFLLSILVSIYDFYVGLYLPIWILIILFLNRGFLNFVRKEENFKFALVSSLLIFLRNTIWIYALGLGLFQFIFKKRT